LPVFPVNEIVEKMKITCLPKASLISKVSGCLEIYNRDDDDASEDNNPKLGRPGIVVFSGGTAFNAASVEMASRNVDDNDIGGGVSRSNSLGSLVDLLDTIESKSIEVEDIFRLRRKET
jgi:hypothetical protein